MNEFFEDRPAPWRVEKHRMGGASVVDASNYTVLTCNGAALAEFVCDAANAYATDEYVFVAASNNADKIAVLTAQRDEAREQLAAAQARIAELTASLVNERERASKLHDALRRLAARWADAAFGYDNNPRRQGEAEMLRQCAYGLSHALDAALAGVEPATRGE